MIGERAEMAVTPQMEQPAAIKALMRGARPSLLPNQGITVNPVPTEKITAGIPTVFHPSLGYPQHSAWRRCKRFLFAARQSCTFGDRD